MLFFPKCCQINVSASQKNRKTVLSTPRLLGFWENFVSNNCIKEFNFKYLNKIAEHMLRVVFYLDQFPNETYTVCVELKIHVLQNGLAMHAI